MNFINLISKTRSTRRFRQDRKISVNRLRILIKAANLCPSAMNRQPMKYLISNTAESNAVIFDCLIWAPYIKDWPGPAEGQKPAAYLIMLLDTEISKEAELDAGIQAQSILLFARSMGIAGCMMEKIDKEKLAGVLEIPERYKIQLVLALGYSDEKIIMEKIVAEEEGGHGIKFYHAEDGSHHVPKRRTDELIFREI